MNCTIATVFRRLCTWLWTLNSSPLFRTLPFSSTWFTNPALRNCSNTQESSSGSSYLLLWCSLATSPLCRSLSSVSYAESSSNSSCTWSTSLGLPYTRGSLFSLQSIKRMGRSPTHFLSSCKSLKSSSDSWSWSKLYKSTGRLPCVHILYACETAIPGQFVGVTMMWSLDWRRGWLRVASVVAFTIHASFRSSSLTWICARGIPVQEFLMTGDPGSSFNSSKLFVIVSLVLRCDPYFKWTARHVLSLSESSTIWNKSSLKILLTRDALLV